MTAEPRAGFLLSRPGPGLGNVSSMADQVTLRPVAEDDLSFLEYLHNDPAGAGQHEWHGWSDPGSWRRGSSEEITVDAAPSKPGRTYPYPRDWLAVHDTLAAPPPLHLRNRDLAYWFSYLREADLVYFQFNGVEDHPAEPFAAFCDRLFAFIDSHRSARLVIDVRWNGGGITFLTQPLLHHLTGSQVINRRGSLFVIIGRLTFSAAQNTVTAIERETHAIFVGEPTGSRPNFIGETIPFELPYSKVTANVADLYWQTSWPMDYRPWIAPDLYAPPTFEAYSQNRDPAMEAILASHDHLPGS
jgi:hypothetical protein